MFRTKVYNQYIGKSKLNLVVSSLGFPINNKSLIGEIANRLFIPGGEKVIPDYFLSGVFFPGVKYPTFKVNFDLDKIGPENNDILYITGVPKDSPSLNNFRLQGKKWSSYYEDEHGGYLFQILPYDQPLKFISHGT